MEEMAHQLTDALDREFPGVKIKQARPPMPPFGGRLPGDTTVSEDILALKAKLDQIMRGLEALKRQL